MKLKDTKMTCVFFDYSRKFIVFIIICIHDLEGLTSMLYFMHLVYLKKIKKFYHYNLLKKNILPIYTRVVKAYRNSSLKVPWGVYFFPNGRFLSTGHRLINQSTMG